MAKTVSVFGSGTAGLGDKRSALAEELGRLLASAGYAMANGGYGGTMTAGAKGASEAGGEVIGVTCSAFGRKGPNRYVSREIVTASLDERLHRLIELGNAYVVLPGGTGTLLELAMVWELKNKGFLSGDKPIILLGKYWRPLVELVATDDPDSGRQLLFADEPKDVIELLRSHT